MLRPLSSFTGTQAPTFKGKTAYRWQISGGVQRGVSNEAVALDAVRRYVWSGMHDADEIVEIIDEAIFEPGQIDQVWLRAEIEKASRQKRIEE